MPLANPRGDPHVGPYPYELGKKWTKHVKCTLNGNIDNIYIYILGYAYI